VTHSGAPSCQCLTDTWGFLEMQTPVTLFFFFFFVVLGFELRTFTFSHSTSTFCLMGFFEIGSRFKAQACFELQFSDSCLLSG
jgi:hypothetical protein